MPPSTPPAFHRHQILSRRFELLAPLGRGGMGEVWLARDRELEMRIAVKLLLPHLAATEGAVAFMKNECRAARRLSHPHIVRVFDFHQDGTLAFISMEWVEGPTFDRWTPSQAVDLFQPIRVLVQVADALADIHRQGLVHRDVKARNILLTPAGTPKLTDFGIVGLWRFQPGMLDVQSGGSRAVMSPQQREGQPPHPSDDIYAFGVLLLETLTRIGWPVDPKDRAAASDPASSAWDSPLRPDDIAANLGQLAAAMQASERSDRPGAMVDVRRALDTALSSVDDRTTPPATDGNPSPESPETSDAERIAAQAYSPAAEGTAGPRPRPFLWAMALTAGAVGLMAAGIWIIGLLSQPPAPVKPTAAVPAPTAADRPPTQAPEGVSTAPQAARPAPTSAALAEAEKKLALWLVMRDRLEEAHTIDWAPEPHEVIAAGAREADAAMMARAYGQAANAYARAIAAGEALLAEREGRFKTALTKGRGALETNRPVEARRHFEQALKIKPDDTGARQGLDAAAVREKTLALMATGQAHEREGRYDLALADYETVLKNESTFAPAREAVERLKNQFAETQYNRLLAAGLDAFYANRLKQARSHIQAALQFRPQGHEAREVLRQIDTAAREQRIMQLRRQGQNAAQKEQWDQALKTYESVLAIDPAIQFARVGAAHSRERVRLDKRLQYYLDHPEVLASERYLEEARQLLKTVEVIAPRGPRLAGQIRTLQASLRTAQTLVPVTLLSDGQTEVAVLRVARLGRITQQTLELRPGVYTIVGARNGYKDVRQTIRVEADQQALQVTIACKEKI